MQTLKEEECVNCITLESENTELQTQLIEMEERAHHDVLTSLPNRRFFITGLQSRISRCQRYGDVTALLFLDVDNLKAVNDSHGHIAGDSLLIQLSKILAANIRAADMVARIGGDEFAILLDNMDSDEVDKKIEFLIDRIGKANVRHEGAVLNLSAAIGYCVIGPKDSVQGLMTRADAAMYEAKKDAR